MGLRTILLTACKERRVDIVRTAICYDWQFLDEENQELPYAASFRTVMEEQRNLLLLN